MVSFVLNGEAVTADGVGPHTTLLQWLRSTGLCGTKEGCAEGECGACAVAILRSGRLEAVNSCLVPLAVLEGATLFSVEGVAEPDGTLHPVQCALVESGGSQCGYCTPGFVVSLFCEYYRPERAEYDPEGISGNLCRCTGYRPIIDAARSLSAPSPDDRRLPLLRSAPARVATPLCPTDLAGVFAALERHPKATLIAGGTDLLVEANQKGRRFEVLIALGGVAELQRFEVTGDEVSIGAGLTLSALERRLHAAPELLPLVRELLPLFSSRLIRNQATLGGNLATASPIGDAAPALLALDAELTLVSASGQRRLPLREFFTGYRTTGLAPGELIEAVHCRLPLPRWQRFYKVSKRVLDDISTVAAGFGLDLDAEGRVERLRLAYGGVAATPLRVSAVEALAAGKPWSEETIAELVSALQASASPLSDHRGSAAYRLAMMGRLLQKFFHETHEASA